MSDWKEKTFIVYVFGLVLAAGIFSQISTSIMWSIIAFGVVSIVLILAPVIMQRFVDRRFERLASEAGLEDRHITPLPWAYRAEMLWMGLFRPYRHAAIRLDAGGRHSGAMKLSIRSVRRIPFDRVYGKLCVGLPYELRRAARTEHTPFREILARYTAAARVHGPERTLGYIRIGRSPLEGLEYLENGVSPEYAAVFSAQD